MDPGAIQALRTRLMQGNYLAKPDLLESIAWKSFEENCTMPVAKGHALLGDATIAPMTFSAVGKVAKYGSWLSTTGNWSLGSPYGLGSSKLVVSLAEATDNQYEAFRNDFPHYIASIENFTRATRSQAPENCSMPLSGKGHIYFSHRLVPPTGVQSTADDANDAARADNEPVNAEALERFKVYRIQDYPVRNDWKEKFVAKFLELDKGSEVAIFRAYGSDEKLLFPGEWKDALIGATVVVEFTPVIWHIREKDGEKTVVTLQIHEVTVLEKPLAPAVNTPSKSRIFDGPSYTSPRRLRP